MHFNQEHSCCVMMVSAGERDGGVQGQRDRTNQNLFQQNNRSHLPTASQSALGSQLMSGHQQGNTGRISVRLFMDLPTYAPTCWMRTVTHPGDYIQKFTQHI